VPVGLERSEHETVFVRSTRGLAVEREAFGERFPEG
jgi:hypothetical protein